MSMKEIEEASLGSANETIQQRRVKIFLLAVLDFGGTFPFETYHATSNAHYMKVTLQCL